MCVCAVYPRVYVCNIFCSTYSTVEWKSYTVDSSRASRAQTCNPCNAFLVLLNIQYVCTNTGIYVHMYVLALLLNYCLTHYFVYKAGRDIFNFREHLWQTYRTIHKHTYVPTYTGRTYVPTYIGPTYVRTPYAYFNESSVHICYVCTCIVCVYVYCIFSMCISYSYYPASITYRIYCPRHEDAYDKYGT